MKKNLLMVVIVLVAMSLTAVVMYLVMSPETAQKTTSGAHNNGTVSTENIAPTPTKQYTAKQILDRVYEMQYIVNRSTHYATEHVELAEKFIQGFESDDQKVIQEMMTSDLSSSYAYDPNDEDEEYTHIEEVTPVADEEFRIQVYRRPHTLSGYVDMVDVISANDGTVLRRVSANRGNCAVTGGMPALPAKLKYGGKWNGYLQCHIDNVLSIEVTTDKGEYTYNIR